MSSRYEDDESLTEGENSYFVDTTDRTINSAEFVRITNQDRLVTASMDLLPCGFHPEGARILDVACGTGGWVRAVALAHPEIEEIIGFDNNKVEIHFNRNLETTKYNDRVKFELMNILALPWSFPDAHFDLVNVRFISGVMSRDENVWIQTIRECMRVLKPGGMFRLTESEMSWVPNAPATNTMLYALMQVLWKMNKSFASWQIAVTPVLADLLRQSGLTDIQEQIIGLDYSSGTDLHTPVTEDYLAIMRNTRKGLMSLGGIPEDEFDTIFKQMEEEFKSPRFRARWPLVSWQGRKAEV